MLTSTNNFEPHLVIRDLTLLPGGEWQPSASSWLVIGVTSGVAYWMHLLNNRELHPGSVLVISNAVKGTIRSSQLSQTTLRFFQVNPESFTGLATVGEQRWLQYAASQESLGVRVFAGQSPLADGFQRLCDRRKGNELGFRLQLLMLFVEALGTEWRSKHPQEQGSAGDAKARLLELLDRTPASELMNMDVEGLARLMCCTPRHVSRTFRDVVGVSFRQKQTEVRLNRATELLANTRSKVLDVALESGYQSLSLFNLMFKRRFGLTPAKWRESALRKTEKPSLNRCRRVAGI